MTFHHKVNQIWGSNGFVQTILACLAAHTACLAVGLTQGYSAILIPQLQTNESSTIYVNDNQGSWVASLAVLSNPIGALMAGSLSEYSGRRITVQLSSIPFIAGWLTIGFANHVYLLYIGRFITGLAAGMITTTYTYIAEVSPPTQRGILSALGPVITSFGVLIVYVLGYILTWENAAFVCTGLSGLIIIAMQFAPESPSWLVNKDRYLDAYKVLRILRGNATQAERDLTKLLDSKQLSQKSIENYLQNIRMNLKNVDISVMNITVSNKVDNDENSLLGSEKEESIWTVILSRKTIIPFGILVMFFLFQELSGIYIILSYSVTFIGDVDPDINDYLGTILVGTLRFVSSIFGAVLILLVRRKILATVSGVGMGVFLIICGSYVTYYTPTNSDNQVASWLPLACILGSVIFSMFGFLQLPFILNSELFPLKVRGFMSGVILSLANIFIFITLKIYPDMMKYLQLNGILFLFGCSSLVGAIYCIAFLPETKNKTLAEIEASFLKNSPKNDSENPK